MNSTESALLNLVVRCWWPLTDLHPQSVDRQMMGYLPGVSENEIIAALEDLFRRGDLSTYRLPNLASKASPHFVPTREEMRDGIMGQDPIFFGLTTQGGARWEAASAANWNRFIDEVHGPRREAEITSADPDLVERCVEYKPHGLILLNENWDTLEPWAATYWKTLDRGHRVRFQYDYKPEGQVKFSYRRWREWADESQSWYVDPFHK